MNVLTPIYPFFNEYIGNSALLDILLNPPYTIANNQISENEILQNFKHENEITKQPLVRIFKSRVGLYCNPLKELFLEGNIE